MTPEEAKVIPPEVIAAEKLRERERWRGVGWGYPPEMGYAESLSEPPRDDETVIRRIRDLELQADEQRRELKKLRENIEGLTQAVVRLRRQPQQQVRESDRGIVEIPK